MAQKITLIETGDLGRPMLLHDLIAIAGLDVVPLVRMIDDQDAQALTILDGMERIGSLVMAVEAEPDGERVMVVHALTCRPVDGVDMTDEILTKLGALAEMTGIRRLRFWTARRGLVKKLTKRGARVRYIVEIDRDGKQFGHQPIV